MAPLKSTLFFTTLTIVITTTAFLPLAANAHPNVTALYAFGDSIQDPGNNNFINTLFRADHKPYGKDFFNGIPTGRFTNGKLATDIVASTLEVKELLPAYLDLGRRTKEDLFTGVSFASAATGLDDMTARRTSVITMDKQLDYFKEALKAMGKGPKVNRALSNGLFMISGGTNDMLYNFFAPSARKNYTASEYQDFLLNRLESFVKKLSSMGARKIAVMGLPPMGCLPLELAIPNSDSKLPPRKRTCEDRKNRICQVYNAKLQTLLPRLSSSLPSGSKIAYIDIYTPILDMILHPANYGFEKTMKGCCGNGYVDMGPLCNAFSPVCSNSRKFLFWDAVHPTQAAYEFLAAHFIKNVLPKLY